jgi:hypothetical protein
MPLKMRHYGFSQSLCGCTHAMSLPFAESRPRSLHPQYFQPVTNEGGQSLSIARDRRPTVFAEMTDPEERAATRLIVDQ